MYNIGDWPNRAERGFVAMEGPKQAQKTVHRQLMDHCYTLLPLTLYLTLLRANNKEAPEMLE